ncbi:MAG: AAA family ATPase, partial [Candidatus Nitrosothermus koennekii]
MFNKLYRMRIVITGTPGVGKHTIADMLAKRLKYKIIDINSLALQHNAIIGKDYAFIIDIEKMKDIIKDELDDNCIIVGHVAPYVLENDYIDYVIVLRRSPYELEEVYRNRGYDIKKMKDNL